ncbi:MAG: hypothetical protein GY710_12175, partial [Desulfobacteraceae bacterium]|nr:hypothetical protein [Desulfobacteraceae bacterium]
MASFSGGVITNKGKDLKAKTDTGVTLELLRIVMGDGVVTQGTDTKTLNSLVNQVKVFDISSFTFLGSGRTRIRANLSNAGLVTGFYAKEVGLIANDPDEGEILYSYAAADPADWIPPEDESFQQIFDIIALTGNTENITISLDPNVANLSLADMQDHEAKQLDPTDTDTAKEKHLSNAQAKKWEDHTKNKSNPHAVTKAQVGLSSLPNAKSDSTGLSDSNSLATSKAVKAANDSLNTHKALVVDPSSTNTAKEKHLSNAQAKIWQDHTANKSNPHAVTKAQVGLSSLPNAKSDSTGLSNSNSLATSKAVKTVNDSLNTHKTLLADPTSTTTQRDKHLSNAQAKKWEDHTDDINLHTQNNILINGNFD